jgi:hypothetical protein
MKDLSEMLDLLNTSYSFQVFSSLDISGEDLSSKTPTKIIDSSVFHSCHLVGTDVSGMLFHSCSFNHCYFNNLVHKGTFFYRCSFDSCKFGHLHEPTSNWVGNSFIRFSAGDKLTVPSPEFFDSLTEVEKDDFASELWGWPELPSAMKSSKTVEPTTNSGRQTCWWCNGSVKYVPPYFPGSSDYSYCSKCGK